MTKNFTPQALAGDGISALQVPLTSLRSFPAAEPWTQSLREADDDIHSTLKLVDKAEWDVDLSDYFAADGGVDDAFLSEIWARHSRRGPDINELLTPVVQTVTFSETITFTSDNSVLTTSVTQTTTFTIFPGKPLNQITTTTQTNFFTITETRDPTPSRNQHQVDTPSETPGPNTSVSVSTGSTFSDGSMQTFTTTIFPNSTATEGAPGRSSDLGTTTKPASVIAPAVIAALLGVVLLLILFGYFVVRRRQKRVCKTPSTDQAEMIDAWDVRPMPTQTNSGPEAPNRRNEKFPTIPIGFRHSLPLAGTSTSVEAARASSEVLVSDGTSSRSRAQQKPLPSAPGINSNTLLLAKPQSVDSEAELGTHATAGSTSDQSSSPSASTPTTRSGQVNVIISEILEGFTSEIRAEIHRAVTLREGRSTPTGTRRLRAGRNSLGGPSRVQSGVSQGTAPPEYQE